MARVFPILSVMLVFNVRAEITEPCKCSFGTRANWCSYMDPSKLSWNFTCCFHSGTKQELDEKSDALTVTQTSPMDNPATLSVVATSQSSERGTKKSNLLLIRGSFGFHAAEDACGKVGRHLFNIDSQEKQNEAVALAKTSDIENIAIGVYKNVGKWLYGNGRQVTFTAWARQPNFFQFFCGMSKKDGYLWSPVSTYDGAICAN